jgi:hypothetical protein
MFLAILPGDGVGPEFIAQATRVLKSLERHGIRLGWSKHRSAALLKPLLKRTFLGHSNRFSGSNVKRSVESQGVIFQ